MKTGSSPRIAALAGIGLVLAFAILYLATLDDGLRPGELAGGDLITHQYAQVQGRFSNAPGYPLYTMGGWLWFHTGRLILGPDYNPIRILSSYSTLWALLALWLLYRLILEVMEPERSRPETLRVGLAALVTAFYGLTYFFWYYAVTTEQYTSAVAWTLAVVLLAFRWERERRDRYLLGLALLGGIGLAHMLTLLIIAPPVLWFVLRTDPKLLRRGRLIVAILALVALPLFSYVFVYVRGAQHPEWRGAGDWTSTWQWFLSFISTRQGRSELTWSLKPFFTGEFPSLIWREMTWPGLIAALLGISRGRAAPGARPLRRAGALPGLLLDRPAGQLVPGDHARLCAAGRGNRSGSRLGLAEILGCWRAREAGGKTVSSAPPLLCSPAWSSSALIALTAYRGIASYPRANAHGRADDTGLVPGWAILADDPPAGAAVLGTQAEALALNYLTEIWGQRPDLRSVTSDQARGLLAQGAPLAVTEAALPLVPAEVSPDAHYSALGRTLVALNASPLRSLQESGATALGSRSAALDPHLWRRAQAPGGPGRTGSRHRRDGRRAGLAGRSPGRPKTGRSRCA